MLEQLEVRLRGARFDVVNIGSSQGPDTDLAVIGLDEGPSVSSVGPLFDILCDSYGVLMQYHVMVRQDHMGSLQEGEPILHLLYYPSMWHLRQWELPSFVAHIASTALDGQTRLGTYGQFCKVGEAAPPFGVNALAYQLAKYQELLIGNLIYLAVPRPAVPYRLVLRLFKYALTHLAREARQHNWDETERLEELFDEDLAPVPQGDIVAMHLEVSGVAQSMIVKSLRVVQ